MTSLKDKAVSSADIEWNGNEPFSKAYGDVYYSRENGLLESKYVFYDGNELATKLVQGDRCTPLTVFETGFGTGLNFLLTWHLWTQLAEDLRRPLHFISIEKHPLSRSDFINANNNWPELSHLTDQVAAQYPYAIKGQHTVNLVPGQVTLTLLYGDINADLKDYNFKVDAWYLDGFAPSKNPDMWTNSLFDFMQRHSRPHASFSTFTAASIVRRSLQDKGFDVAKKKGFGRKREMLTGYYSGTEQRINITTSLKDTWSLPAESFSEGSHSQVDCKYDFDAIVLGAGLAGASTAHALAVRGLSVALLDANKSPMSGASGQSQLVMYAKLPTERNKVFSFIEHALCYSLLFYPRLQTRNPDNHFWQPCGLLQLSWNEKERNKAARLFNNIQLPEDFIKHLNSEEAREKTGLPLNNGGIWFEHAGWLSPSNYARALSHPNIKHIYNAPINSIIQNANRSWAVGEGTQKLNAKKLIICTANETKHFEQLSHLPIKPLRGQVTSVYSDTIKPAKSVICGEGYLCPAINQWHHIGATFDLENTSTNTFDADDAANIANINKWLPEFGLNDNFENPKGNAGLRCTTPDYLPLVGRAPIFEKMVERFQRLRVGANDCHGQYGDYYENLYINVGHGSKGLFTTPLAAEMIACEITGAPLPLSETHRIMLSPARFIIKHLKQRRI